MGDAGWLPPAHRPRKERSTQRGAWGRLTLALAIVAVAVNAESPSYRVEPSLTTAEFVATQFGVFRARGHFAQASGRIAYDPLGLAGSVDFDLAAASVRTGWSARDAFIRGEDMFDAEHHPLIRSLSQFAHVQVPSLAY